MKNKKIIKYIYLFTINLFKINRYKLLNYEILFKNYKFDNFIKEVNKKYGSFKKIKYPNNMISNEMKEVTKKSFNESNHLKDSLSSRFFFYELNSYFNNDYFICLNSSISKKLLDSFHLFPPNIFVLDKMYDLYQNKKIGDNLVIDFPCGITNFHQYLSVFYNEDLLIGIDNFSQISKEDILKYQSNLKKFEIFESIEDHYFENSKTDVVVAISIEIRDITSDILKLEPKYIFLGSSDLNHDLKNLETYFVNYSLDEINHAYILLKRN